MKKKIKKFVFPGLGIAASFLGSFSFAIGAITAFLGTELFMKKYIKTGRIKEIKLNLKNWEIHLHHWIMASLIILGALSFNKIEIFPIAILGFLNGLIFHDIYTDKKWRNDDKKWYQFVYRKEPAEY